MELELLLFFDGNNYNYRLKGDYYYIRIGTRLNPEVKEGETYLTLSQIFPSLYGLYPSSTFLSLEFFGGSTLRILYEGKQVAAIKPGNRYSHNLETYNGKNARLIINYIKK